MADLCYPSPPATGSSAALTRQRPPMTPKAPKTPKTPRTVYFLPTPAGDDYLDTPVVKRRRLNSETPSPPAPTPPTPAVASPSGITGERAEAEEEPDRLENTTPIRETCVTEYRLRIGNTEDWLSGFTNVYLDDELDIDFEHQTHLEGPHEQVCFGMICDLPVAVNDLESVRLHGVLPAVIDSNGQVLIVRDVHTSTNAGWITQASLAEGHGFCIGTLSALNLQILAGLSSDPSVVLQPLCRVDMRQAKDSAPRKERTFKLSASLSVNVYGHFELFDRVGQYLEVCNICLQDPLDCDRNVRYRNPQRLSGLAVDAPFTLEEQIRALEICKEVLGKSTDYLSNVGNKDYLPEANTPHALQTDLYSHQKQGLSFMLHRERGWDMESQWPDIWKLVQLDGGGTLYMNTITEETFTEPPQPFYGGILADHMGLGKTLGMIALIASDYDESGTATTRPPQPIKCQASVSVKTTLIVVPLPLLYTWEQQLKRHVGSSLKWLFYHGSKRSLSKEQLATHHIVLTTYQTVASEWKRLDSAYGPLFSVYWNRVILDEAHVIRERSTLSAQALCQLRAARRWAVSGTPIQNRLTDLSTTLEFLQVYPYNDPKVFNKDISQLWKSGSEAAAVARLKSIIHCISLRRSSSTITLPERRNELHRLQFSSAERKQYDKVQANALFYLNAASAGGTTVSKQYFHFLKQITSLRQLCNLGLFAPCVSQAEDPFIDEFLDLAWSENKAQEAVSGMIASGAVTCFKCKKEILNHDDMTPDEEQSLHVSECIKVIHAACLVKGMKWFCTCEPRCDIAQVTMTQDYPARCQTTMSPFLGQSIELPTKIRAVVDDIELFRTTKSVVFSQWLSTLDVIAQALKARLIPFLRYDSTVSQRNRVKALDDFQNSSNYPVILFTISCGAVGLDLTAANRAYIIEPHWNPTVEEQALARIHRLGQTREITTIRYVMSNTYEDHILKIQNKKRDLVNMLLAQKKNQGQKIRLQDIQSMFEL